MAETAEDKERAARAAAQRAESAAIVSADAPHCVQCGEHGGIGLGRLPGA